jgi:regulator of replication initiation timing
MDEFYQRLRESTKLLQEANKNAFFFLSICKDLEMIKHCPTCNFNYTLPEFDLNQYQTCIDSNLTALDSFDSESYFNQIQQKIIDLDTEFKNHKESNITPQLEELSKIHENISQIQYMDSPDVTVSPSFTDDKIASSSINLAEFPDSRLIQQNETSENGENSLNLTQAKSGKNLFRQSYSNLESKVGSLETDLGDMVKHEAYLKGEISKLKIERDQYKKMLHNGESFKELQNAISYISTAILTNSKVEEVKFNQQVVLKNLIDDDFIMKLNNLDRQISKVVKQKADIKEKFQFEIKRSSSNAQIAFKYIELVKTCISACNEDDQSWLQETLSRSQKSLSSDNNRVLINNDLTLESSAWLSRDNEFQEHELQVDELLFNASMPKSPKAIDSVLGNSMNTSGRRHTSRPRKNKLSARKSVEEFGKRNPNLTKNSITIDFSVAGQGPDQQQAE